MWFPFKTKAKSTTSRSDGGGKVAPRPAVPTRVAAPEPVASTGSSGIAYDPTLIAKLKSDHVELVALYTRLLNAATAARAETIADDLVHFRRAFQSHIVLENVRFYVYMDRLLTTHPEEREYVRSLRKDMNGISKAVAEFIHTWVTTPPDASTLPTFEEQLKGIGAALTDRVQLEENSLYTLYAASL